MDTIKVSALRNIELIQFGDGNLAIVQRNDIQALMIQEEYDNYFNANAIVSELYKKDAANPFTKAIQDADKRRDDAINGINNVLLGYTYHFDAVINKEANLLYKNLASYGSGIARLNYQSETATIRSVLADWVQKPELVTAVTSLKLNEWKNELEVANNAFDALYIDRTQDIGNTADATFKVARTVATDAYHELCNALEAYIIIKKGKAKEPYIKVISEMNALIKQYNSMLANRTGNNTPTPTAEL